MRIYSRFDSSLIAANPPMYARRIEVPRSSCLGSALLEMNAGGERRGELCIREEERRKGEAKSSTHSSEGRGENGQRQGTTPLFRRGKPVFTMHASGWRHDEVQIEEPSESPASWGHRGEGVYHLRRARGTWPRTEITS